MAKIRTLSRAFMKGHPKAGQPTHFVEKVYNSINPGLINELPKDMNKWWFDNELNKELALQFDKTITDKKHHTIRMGTHFKPQDKITLAVWSGMPYRSKQINLWTGPIRAIDIEIRVGEPWEENREPLEFWKNDEVFLDFNTLAANDGLSPTDFYNWFIGTLPKKKERAGQPTWHEAQILIWNPEINY